MKPKHFEQATKILSATGCDDLHVWSDGKDVLSCWKPSPREILRLVFGGRVWLWVAAGGTQPPVAVETREPFKK
jgi:hypothetical protein